MVVGLLVELGAFFVVMGVGVINQSGSLWSYFYFLFFCKIPFVLYLFSVLGGGHLLVLWIISFYFGLVALFSGSFVVLVQQSHWLSLFFMVVGKVFYSLDGSFWLFFVFYLFVSLGICLCNFVGGGFLGGIFVWSIFSLSFYWKLLVFSVFSGLFVMGFVLLFLFFVSFCWYFLNVNEVFFQEFYYHWVLLVLFWLVV